MLTTKLKNIANAIRNKTQTSVTMTLDEMPSKIESIETASKPNLQDKEVTPTKQTQVVNYDENYDGLNQVTVKPIPSEYIIPSGVLEITENGEKDVTNYSNVNVNVPSNEPILQDKSITITSNGTQTIKADSGYDGLNEVEVITNIASSGGGDIPEKGLIINQYSDNGFPTDVTLKNVSLSSSYMYLFGTASTASNYYNTLSAIARDLKKLTVDGVTFTSNRIPNSFCQGAYYLEEIYFQNCIRATSTGGSSFKNCVNLKKVELPNTVTTLDTDCFNNCKSLTNCDLTNITVIGQQAFYGCTNLSLSELPSGITAINAGAFYKCNNVNIKKIPDKVIQLLTSTFYGTGATQVSMANVTKMLGTSTSTGAFGNCVNLKAVWIGSAITTIDSHVFYGDANLTKIFIDLPRATVEAFSNYPKAFMNDASKIGIIICNDDEGFMTKEQFEAIDWATYIG